MSRRETVITVRTRQFSETPDGYAKEVTLTELWDNMEQMHIPCDEVIAMMVNETHARLDKEGE